MLGHFIHAQSYIAQHIASDICFLIWNKDVEWKKGLTPDKSFKKTFGEKESDSDKSEFSKKQVWHQVNLRDKVKAQSNCHSKVSLDKWIRMSLIGSWG